jgi:hypothetical protein
MRWAYLSGELSGFKALDDGGEGSFDCHLGLVDRLTHSGLVLFGDFAHTLHDISEDTFRTRDGSFVSLKLCARFDGGRFLPYIGNDCI